VNNFNNNALGSFIAALLFQDAVNKAAATGTLNRQTLFAALKDEHSFTADGIVGPTDIGGRVGPPARCSCSCRTACGTGWTRSRQALRLQRRQQHHHQVRRLIAAPACRQRRTRSRRMASRGRRKSVGVVEMAQDLGVSTATVSRALNSNPSVRRSSPTASGHTRRRAVRRQPPRPGAVGEHQPGVRRFVIPYVDTLAYSRSPPSAPGCCPRPVPR